MEDAIFDRRKKNLIVELKSLGINDINVLNAINRTPRHLFMDSIYKNFSYENKAYQIDCGQTISQPYMVALQTQLLELTPNDKVLEIGTGSGYQTAVLSCLCKEVYTIERHKKLYTKAFERLCNLNYDNVKCFYGDGYNGLKVQAPFDKIIVTAAANELPEQLILQLKISGTMVIPLGKTEMNLYKIKRLSEFELESKKIEKCAFVPMLKGLDL